MFERLLINRDVARIEKSLTTAPLQMEPFAHLIARDVLPPRALAFALEHWPQKGTMPDDGGDLGRHCLHLLTHDKPLPDRNDADPWQRFVARYGRHIIRNALDRFRTFNEARFGADATYTAQFDLLEAGPTFTQHGAHNHHHHGPGWAMTFLLFIDDGERTDRGEVFSAPTSDTPWGSIVTMGPGLKLEVAKRIDFIPNTLLAWLDGPMSYHGTDQLPLDAVNRRRMIRCHVIVREPFLERALGMNSLRFIEICQSFYKGDDRDLNELLRRPGNPIDAIPRFSYVDVSAAKMTAGSAPIACSSESTSGSSE